MAWTRSFNTSNWLAPRPPPRLAPPALGFTLIEIMVTVAIVAVLLALAMPNLRNQILASQARQTARGVKDALDFARQYALNTSTITTFASNGCGYSVTATNAGRTTVLKSSTDGSDWAVDCSGNLGTVSFMGDGSASSCAPNGGSTVCQPLTGNRVFSASGGNSNWTVTLLSSGLTTP